MSGAGFMVPPGSSLLTGLVASWRLDDLTDASGHGNTLTNNNSVTFNSGKIGNAAYFATASSQFLSLASNADVQGGPQDYTIGFWVYFNNFTNTVVMLGKDTDTGREYYFEKDTSNNWSFSTFFTSGNRSHADYDIGTPSTGVWYDVMGWNDATAKANSITVNNGAPVTASYGVDADAATAAQFRIGARQYPGFESYADARIDNVNIWKRVLTAGERTAFYNAGAGVEFPFS